MSTAKTFDPNAASLEDSGVFGLPFSEDESEMVLIPVPWEVTTSYGGGTSQGPDLILEASRQVDLFDADLGPFYVRGIFMQKPDSSISKMNREGRRLAQKIIKVGGQIGKKKDLISALKKVNQLGAELNQKVYRKIRSVIEAGKIPGLIGGDHATPFGAFQAVAESEGEFGILHFDAHSDTRKAFEGFQWSHASIMYNALEKIPQIKKLTQVGIRDFCEEEFEYTQSQGKRVSVFFDREIQKRKFEGSNWKKISDEIIATLPQKIWISFDIDGLDPRFCPNTGTPVPGGLEFSEATYLIRALAQSGRKIIGFDLNEVSAGETDSEWDGNVGARLLYQLCGNTFFTQRS